MESQRKCFKKRKKVYTSTSILYIYLLHCITEEKLLIKKLCNITYYVINIYIAISDLTVIYNIIRFV